MFTLHSHFSAAVFQVTCCKVTKNFSFLDNTAVGEFDGELLLLKLPLQAHNMAVIEPGPDGPGYT